MIISSQRKSQLLQLFDSFALLASLRPTHRALDLRWTEEKSSRLFAPPTARCLCIHTRQSMTINNTTTFKCWLNCEFNLAAAAASYIHTCSQLRFNCRRSSNDNLNNELAFSSQFLSLFLFLVQLNHLPVLSKKQMINI